jgi:hypothetical protein
MAALDELKRILEENADKVKELESPEQLAAFLTQKGIAISAQEIANLLRSTEPVGLTTLDDDALEQVAGGITAAQALVSTGKRIITMLRKNSVAETGAAHTLEQRGTDSFIPTAL